MTERERSKFRGILDATKGRAPTTPEAPARPGPTGPPPRSAPPPPPAAPPCPAPAEAPAPRGPGRPRGKRSDPAFEQVTAYVPRALYRRVRVALLEADRGQEFSELVAELLADWLDTRQRD